MCLLNSKEHFPPAILHVKIYRKVTQQQQELAKTLECVLFTLVTFFSKT